MVPLQLELDSASDHADQQLNMDWIDALFDRFVEEGSDTIRDEHWEDIVKLLRDPFA